MPATRRPPAVRTRAITTRGGGGGGTIGTYGLKCDVCFSRLVFRISGVIIIFFCGWGGGGWKDGLRVRLPRVGGGGGFAPPSELYFVLGLIVRYNLY